MGMPALRPSHTVVPSLRSQDSQCQEKSNPGNRIKTPRSRRKRDKSTLSGRNARDHAGKNRPSGRKGRNPMNSNHNTSTAASRIRVERQRHNFGPSATRKVTLPSGEAFLLRWVGSGGITLTAQVRGDRLAMPHRQAKRGLRLISSGSGKIHWEKSWAAEGQEAFALERAERLFMYVWEWLHRKEQPTDPEGVELLRGLDLLE